VTRFAVKIVDVLLETGEADQDYDQGFYDLLVEELEQAGITGARHKEFDKYQGVYLFIPHVGKFWTVGDDGLSKTLQLEDEPDRQFNIGYFTYNQGQDTAIEDVSELIEFCKRKIIRAQGHQIAINAVDSAMDQMSASGEPVSGKTKATMIPVTPSVGRSGMGQAPSHFPTR
jgi:hypothetical protein